MALGFCAVPRVVPGAECVALRIAGLDNKLFSASRCSICLTEHVEFIRQPVLAGESFLKIKSSRLRVPPNNT